MKIFEYPPSDITIGWYIGRIYYQLIYYPIIQRIHGYWLVIKYFIIDYFEK